MTNKEFRTSISQSAKAVLSRHQMSYNQIDINTGLPYVAIGRNLFFAQGDDASELLDQANAASDKTGLAVSTCLLWYLNGAGVI